MEQQVTRFLALVKYAQAIVDDEDMVWGTKYSLVFDLPIHTALRSLEFLGVQKLDYHDPDSSYEIDTKAYVEALQDKAAEVRSLWKIYRKDGGVKLKATGADLIAAKRAEHFEHGYDAAHDAAHGPEKLLLAAECYMTPEHLRRSTFFPPHFWPFEDAAWKPSKAQNPYQRRIDELVKAGALVAAAIDVYQSQLDAD